MNEKSSRNKTITLTPEDERTLIARCPRESDVSGDMRGSIICGDSFSVMERLPHGAYDLIIADPPYNLSKSYNGSSFSKKSAAEYEAYTRSWMEKCAPLLREGGSIYVCCDWETGIIIGRVLGDYFTVRNRITWQREKGRGAERNWKNCSEDIWFATCGDSFTFNLDAVKLRRAVIAPYREDGRAKDWHEEEGKKWRDTCPSNFWDDITVPFWSMPENTEHPTQKPEKLLAKLILASSKPGDTVFDPFCGVGSSCVTAKKLGRHYVGIEREERYCALAAERLIRADTDKRIQGYEDGFFKARNMK